MTSFEISNINVINRVESIHSHFYYNKEFKILICSVYHVCVTRTSLKKHLNSIHHTHDNKKEYATLWEIVSNLDIKELSQLNTPVNYQHCFPFLTISNNALLCNECSNYIVLNEKRMRVHLNQEHNIKNISKVDLAHEKYFTLNLCVQNFSNNIFKKYFLTKYQETSPLYQNSKLNQVSTNFTNKELQEIQLYNEKKQEIVEKQLIQDTLTFKEYDPFNQASYFHEYIKDKEFNQLIESVDLEIIKKHEHLSLIYQVIRKFFAKYTHLISLVDQRSKQIINSDSLKAKEEDKNLKPFRPLQTSHDNHEYYKIFANLITYIYYSTKIENKNYLQPNFDMYLLQVNALQLDIVRYLSNSDENKEDELENNIFVQVINLSVKLIIYQNTQKTLNRHATFESPLITFLVCKSLNKNNGKFESTTTIQQYCSRLIYMCRYVNILRANNNNQQAIRFNQDFDFEHNLITFDKTYLHNNSSNCFENLCSYRALARHISQNETGNQKIIEISDDIIQCEDVTISISKYKEFFQYILINLERILYNDLLNINKNEIRSLINLSNIRDDFQEQRNNYYFVEFTSKTQNLKEMSSFLIKKFIKQNSTFRQKFYINHHLKSTAIKTYFDKREEFLKFLVIFLYLTTGSPLRGEELATLKYKNSLQASLRELFFDNLKQMFMINLKYSKNQNKTRVQTKNIRYVSQQGSELLAIYIIFVLPFYEYLRIEVLKESTTNSCHLFEIKNEIIKAKTISSFLKNQSNRFLSTPLQLLTNRHLLKYIIRNRMLVTYLEDSDSNSDVENSKIEDKLANHSTKTSNLHYARDQNTLPNTSADAQKISYDFCIKFFRFFNLLKENSQNNKHSRAISADNYLNTQPIIKKQRSFQRINEENELNKELLVGDMNYNLLHLENSLKRFFQDDKASFKSAEQKEALESTLNNISCIFYAAGTSAGKSLIFMLSSYMENDVLTIVAAPLIALKQDMMRRASFHKLKAEIYEETTHHEGSLIFISYETLKNSPNFLKFLVQQAKNHKRIRFVFDEAHFIILQQFRYIMKYVDKINKYKIQLIFLSASFTNEIYQLLIDQFNIDTSDNHFKYIRSSSTRDNLKYIVFEQKTNDFYLEIDNYLKNNIYPSLDAKDKVIIYINNTKQCEALARRITCLCYHAQMSKEDRDSNYKKFIFNDKINTIVATNAFSAGLNISTVRYIIHKFDNLISFINADQEDGRAGRDNNNASCIHFVPPNFSKHYSIQQVNRNLIENSIHNIDRQMYVNFLSQKTCMRQVLEYYFNNNKIEMCLDFQNKCYLCEKREKYLTAKATRQQRKESSKSIEQQEFIDKLSNLKDICVACCFDRNFNLIYTHNLESCITQTATIFEDIKHKLLTLIRKERLLKLGSACFDCFTPQSICNYSKINDDTCLFQNVVLDLFVFQVQLQFRFNSNNSYKISEFDNVDQSNTTTIIRDLASIFCQKSTIFSTDCIQAINIVNQIKLGVFISNEDIDSMENISNFNNNSELIDNNIDNEDLDQSTLSYPNFENSSSDSLSTILNLSNFSITTRNQYKEHVKQVKKERKAKISILKPYSIEDFI